MYNEHIFLVILVIVVALFSGLVVREAFHAKERFLSFSANTRDPGSFKRLPYTQHDAMNRRLNRTDDILVAVSSGFV